MNKVASVIILTYKKFEYVFETIDSVLEQNYSCIELIVADDGSDNFPLNDIELYVKKHKKSNIVSIKIYSNKTNLGTVRNLNTSINESIGDYIINLAGDDKFYDETVVSKIVQRLDQSKNGVITCRRVLCDELMQPLRYMPSDSHIREIIKLTSKNKQHSAFLKGEFYELASGSCTYYIKQQLIADGMFNEKFRLLEDYSHFLEITRKYQIETAYDIIAIFYRSGGISSSIPKVLLDDYLLLMKDEQNSNSNKLTKFEKRYLKWNIERFSSKSKIFIHLRYFDTFVSRLIYKLKCTIYNKRALKQFKRTRDDLSVGLRSRDSCNISQR